MEIIDNNHPNYVYHIKMVNKDLKFFPFAILLCSREEDVIDAIEFARKKDKSIRIRGGRHSYNGLSTGDEDCVVIDIAHLDQIKINDYTINVGGGCQLYYDIYEPLWRIKKKSIVGGSCPTVGIGGLATGGGFSFSGRKFGLTVDNIEEVRIVLSDGKVHIASPSNKKDLFWAICGAGGGNFGIITDFKIKTFDVNNVQTYRASWKTSELVAAYMNWFNFLLNTTKDIMPFFKIGVEKLNDSPTISSFGQMYEQPLSYLFESFSREFKSTPPDYFRTKKRTALEAIQKWGGLNAESEPVTNQDERFIIHNNDFKLSDNHSFYADSVMIKNELTNEQLNEIKNVVSSSNVNGFILFDGHANGYSSMLDKSTNAYAHRDCLASVQIYSSWQLEEDKIDSVEFVANISKILRKNNSGAYVNYSNPDNANWFSDYFGDHCEQLINVKKKYDPDNIFRHGQSIP